MVKIPRIVHLNDMPKRELCSMVERVKVLLELPDPSNVDVVVDLIFLVVVGGGAVDTIVVVVVVVAPSASFNVLYRPAEPNSHRL